MKVYTLTGRTRGAPLLLGFAALAVGAALLVVGIFVLAGIALVGGILGTGILAWRQLRGRRAPLPTHSQRRYGGLDPALEVFPERQAIPSPQDPSPDDQR